MSRKVCFEFHVGTSNLPSYLQYVHTHCTEGKYVHTYNVTHVCTYVYYKPYIQSKYSIYLLTHAKEIREHFDFSSVLNLFSFIHTPEEINYFAGDLIKKMFRISS